MVSINIQKKDLWLLSAIMVFLVGVAFVIAYGSGDSTVHGHDAGEVEGTGFGDWTNLDSDSNALVKNAVYRATSDGYINALTSTQITPIRGYTDSSNPPATEIGCGRYYGAESGNKASFTIPIKKDEYWRVTGGTVTIYWIPIGTGECQKQ